MDKKEYLYKLYIDIPEGEGTKKLVLSGSSKPGDLEPVINQLRALGAEEYSISEGEEVYPNEAVPKKPYHIGYCAGAFDMFHMGHLNLLKRAKERCDHLIVGVMSDERMFNLKKKYPVIPCSERMKVVAGCRYADQVEELPADRAGIMDTWNMFHYDCMFSGDDHKDDPGWLAERERLRQHGSDIFFLPYTRETSSSEIRDKMSGVLTEKNQRWIYTYDYAPDSVWDEWRSDVKIRPWIDDEAESVCKRLKPGLKSFILLADSHFVHNGTWEDTVSSMKAVAARTEIVGIIHLGDLTDGLLPLDKTEGIERKVFDGLKSVGVPLYVVPGNHDYNYFRNNPEIRYPENPRFYKDLDEIKLRLVFIDSFDPLVEVRYGFSEECISFLESALESLPSGYMSVVFSHLTPLVRLQAWTKDIRNREKLIAVLDSHADRILGLINGHNHCDHLFNDLKNGQFPIISINCAKCEYFTEHKPSGAVVPYRRLGDRTQESFDILQIDAGKKELYFTRFGAGQDRLVREHKAEWV